MNIQCGYVNDTVFLTLLARNLEEKKGSIVTITSTIGGIMLQTVWDELDYRTEVRRLSPGACKINPLNAELNPICHSLILLGDLAFMSTCIVSIFQYIFNKMQRCTDYLYLETALHVSGGTSTHHQERTTVSTASGIYHTVIAICRYRGRVGTGLSVLWVASLHVSGGTSTHHQERIQLHLQHLVFFTPLLLSAAVVEELEPG
jgi:hypothetical protein